MVVTYHTGGIYSNLDFYCKKNLKDLLDRDLLITLEPPEHNQDHELLCVGFFGCKAKNSFIKGFIEYIIDNMDYNNNYPVQTTGPVQFYKYYNSLTNKPEVVDTCLILPTFNTGAISKVCKGKEDINYVYNLWHEGSGWFYDDKKSIEPVIEPKKDKSTIFFIIGLVLSFSFIIYIIRKK